MFGTHFGWLLIEWARAKPLQITSNSNNLCAHQQQIKHFSALIDEKNLHHKVSALLIVSGARRKS